MWNNQNQKSYTTPQDSVNTNISTFFGSMSYLQLACWDDKLSFHWVPARGVSEGTGRVQYDKDAMVKTALSHDKVEALIAQYDVKIAAKLIAGEDPGEEGLMVGVPVMSGRDENKMKCVVCIEYRRDAENPGHYASYFSFVRNVKDDGTIGDVVRYKFNTTQTIVGTTPELGQFVGGQIEGEALWFITLVRAHNDLNRYGDHQAKMINQFKTKNGYNNTPQQNSGYNAPSPANDSFMQMPVDNDMVGMSDFMGLA